MKSFAVVLILSMVVLSFHEGESFRGMKVCKQDIPSAPNSRCKQPECDDACAVKHPYSKAWGSCKLHDNHRFVCECSYLCHHHRGHHHPPAAAPSIPPYNYAPTPTPTYYF